MASDAVVDEPITVDQEHLLKRELLRMQISKESAALDNMINLDQLGFPFLLPNGKYSPADAYPLCSYILRTFVVDFPVVQKADQKFWQETVQPFIQGLASKDVSSSADRDEATKRRRVGRVCKRWILLFFVAGLGTNRSKTGDEKGNESESEEKEAEKEAIEGDETSNDAAEGTDTAPKEASSEPLQMWPGAFGAVIGVRETSSSGFIRSKTRSEYIIECFFNGSNTPVYVARPWADFVELQKQIAASFPGKRMPSLPHKTLKNTQTVHKNEEITLLREPQRLTLREYVKRLCQIPRVAQSDLFLDFLFRDPIDLTPEIRHDIEARLALDRQRMLDQMRFRDIITEREATLGQYVGEIKEEIREGNALPKLFLELKTKKQVEDMSPLLQKAVEWVSVQVAKFLFDLFIGSDSGPDMYNQVKRLHQLMPYTTIRGILKLSNPALILKKLTELFMATPFGKTSLVQQMFIRILNDDMVTQEKLISDLEARLPEEKKIIKAMETYIYEDHYSRVALQQRAHDSRIDLLLEICRSYCDKTTAKNLSDWHQRWQQVVDDPLISGEEDPKVEKYSQLKDLLKLKVRARDKEVMREFWADGLTIKFIREIVNLTYDVFIDIFRYANVSASFGDFQSFMEDLLDYINFATTKVVLDSSEIVDGLLGVLKKHQNSVFKFINRVYSRDVGFFVDIVEWSSLFVAFVQRRKQNLNTLDLLDLMKTSKHADPKLVRDELEQLNVWLQRRKETASAARTIPTLSDNADDFPMAQHMEISDVGLNWDDVDFGMAEVERDDIEEFIADPWTDLTKDQVTLERLRREKLAQAEARKAQMAPRPEMKETEKLLPEFEEMLYDVLKGAKLEKVVLKDIH